MGSDKAKPAYVDDYDDTEEKPVRGTRRSASVVRPREKSKVSSQEDRRARKSDKKRKEIEYPPESSIQALQHVEVPDSDKKQLERRMSSSGHHRSPRKSERPPSAHGNKS
jgi:hypothetical protein